MTSQYDIEDKVVTVDEMVEGWQQEGQTLAIIPERAAAAMNELGVYLRSLWDKAEAAQDNASMQIISDKWAKIEQMATDNVLLANARANADEIIQFLNDERLDLVGKLDTLETALDEGDMSHPALENFAYYLREEAFSDAYEAALSEAESSVFDDIMERIQNLTGCNSFQSYCVTRLLSSNREATPDQVHLLQQLVDTFERKE